MVLLQACPSICARRFKVFRMLFEIRGRAEMPELMRRHVNTDMLRDGVGDLDCERCLCLPPALFRDEEMAIRRQRQGAAVRDGDTIEGGEQPRPGPH